MKKYFINTYGCYMNVHESEKIAGLLEKIGYFPTKEQGDADIIVFNTCCIRETAESKIVGNIGEISHIKKIRKDLIVAICGCMTQQDDIGEMLTSKFAFIDIILGTHNLDQLPNKVEEVIQSRKLKTRHTKINVTTETNISDLPITRTSGVNAWVNIIYGCNNFCTYCIVPYVRGRERSRESQDILNEISSLLKQGYKEITLLGQNVNSYGNDLENNTTFAKLLNSIAEFEKDFKFRLRFMTSHPKDFTDDCIEAISKANCICKSIHLPIQSGSTNTLNSMNRKYTAEHYKNLVLKIRNKIPQVSITTDIMVGFPTETESDYQQTVDLINEIKFNGVFTFVYSKRKGTPAASMQQIPSAIKKERISKLIAIQNQIVFAYSDGYINKTVEVLVEDSVSNNPNTYSGRTDDGRLVHFTSNKNLIGQFINIHITKAKAAMLLGNCVED